MRHRFTSVVLAGTLGALFLATTPTVSLARPYHSIGWRERNQEHRIYQGVSQDQISGREFARLDREEDRIARDRYRFSHNDGHLGPRERVHLQHEINHSSRDIYRARHN